MYSRKLIHTINTLKSNYANMVKVGDKPYKTNLRVLKAKNEEQQQDLAVDLYTELNDLDVEIDLFQKSLRRLYNELS